MLMTFNFWYKTQKKSEIGKEELIREGEGKKGDRWSPMH
jgi:hypothetical protein